VVQEKRARVIATGGSIVSEPGTYDLLLSTCRTVWLKAQPEEHMARVLAQGDTRPDDREPRAMEDLHRILRGRNAAPTARPTSPSIPHTGASTKACSNYAGCYK